MATRYHYDLYPRTDPRDGTRITRFTKLQAATYRDVIGVGSGAGTIRSTDAEADDLDPLGEQFIRVVREDTVAETEATVGGFWINTYKHDTAVARQTKRLTFAGAGTMAYLARSRMAPHTYIHDVFTGQDPFDDRWRLYAQSTVYANGNYLGAMLWRVIYEAQHWRVGTPPHRHKDGVTYTDTHADDRTETAIPDLVLGFDQFEDSDGNPWTAKSGEFSAAVGENVLTVTQRLIQAGLYVEMDPVTFELRAWENSDHRRDRTGGAWGTNVVRFQAPTDGTIATGNMLSDSERELNSHLKRTIVWAGGQDSYAKATGSSDIPWEGFESTDVTETDALEQIANTQITAREEAADAGSVRMKLGATPLSGRYRPWEEVRLDDLVTLDTGSGVWDYTEDTYPVAGLRIELQKSGAWWAWAELGSAQPNLNDRRFQVSPVGPHSHPPNPQLCRPSGAPGAPTSGTVELEEFWDWTTDNDSTPGAYNWAIRNTSPDGSALDASQPVGTATSTWQYSSRMPCTPGSTLRTTGQIARLVGGFSASLYDTLGHRVFWYAAASGGSALSEQVLGSVSVNGLVAASFDWSAVVPVGANYFSLRLSRITQQDNVTVTVTADDASPGEAGTPGDGHIDLIGTSVRASRCDHAHHLWRTEPPTVNDDEADGYPSGTAWLVVDDVDNPTVLIERHILLDNDEGAAIWQREYPEDANGINVYDSDGLVAADVTDLVFDGATVTNDEDGQATVTIDATTATQRWEAVTDGEDVFVWESDDLVHEWKEY